MNRGPFIFLGAFGILAFSWTCLVLTNQITTGRLAPHFDTEQSAVFPAGIPGVVERGHMVYQDLGCAACHTQQVRRPGFGADQERGWGDRQSVARDYLGEDPIQLGQMRIGPDLRNVGTRHEDRDWYYQHLYDPRLVVEGSTMPSYRFLFEERAIVGQPSPEALRLPAQYTPAPGREIVPTERARALVSYLTHLKDTYAFPETNNVYRPAEAAEGDAATEGGH